MKRWKKVGIVLLGVIVLSQLPFAWRRYRLKRLNQAIQQLANQRTSPQNPNHVQDFKGVMHVHSSLGGHSTGTFAEIINAAKSNDLTFVIMTEHPATYYDSAALTLNDSYRETAFIGGNEVSAENGDRLLLIPGGMKEHENGTSTPALIAEEKADGGLALIAYPAEFKSWDQIGEVDGVEVYNLFTNARRANPIVTFFDGLWSYGSYPDLMFANFYERPAEALHLWDQAMLTSRRRLVATAGNDAHANIGLSLKDSSGNQIAGVQLDPYERSFRVVRTHVLLEQYDVPRRESILKAIAAGHCYISFDLFADPRGFGFTAQNESDTKTMGDEISLGSGVTLKLTLPLSARVVLFRDGAKIEEAPGVSSKEFSVTQAGAYRVEVYLPQLPHPVSNQPWIISNPIYVK